MYPIGALRIKVKIRAINDPNIGISKISIGVLLLKINLSAKIPRITTR